MKLQTVFKNGRFIELQPQDIVPALPKQLSMRLRAIKAFIGANTMLEAVLEGITIEEYEEIRENEKKRQATNPKG